MLEDIRERARRLLASGEVKVVVGWREGRRAERPVPHFARRPNEAERFVLSPRCTGGLARYAPRETAAGPAAFVASVRDIRALTVLCSENQVLPENVRIIGYDCDIFGNPMGRITLLEGSRLEEFARLPVEATADSVSDELARVRALSPYQRWLYWRAQFDRCVRCYACRAACPMCYCEECVTDGNSPQWVDSMSRPRGNLAWNVVRAWHLAGRCVECGACARACPEGIRLDVLNRMLSEEVRLAFGHVAGSGEALEGSVFGVFREDDNEAFISG